MKTYKQFHGEIEINQIGKELRTIIKTEHNNFKILTGYGSTSGKSLSKQAVIKSLSKLKKEGLIKGFLPGEVKYQLINSNSYLYEDKMKYSDIIKNDSDFGNEGIIFVFMKSN